MIVLYLMLKTAWSYVH